MLERKSDEAGWPAKVYLAVQSLEALKGTLAERMRSLGQ
jgi:hypothetical protein